MIQIIFGRLKNGGIQTDCRFKRRLTLTIALGKLRADAQSLSPFSARNAAFAQILQHAKGVGVKIRALKLIAGMKMSFDGELDLILLLEPFPGFWPNQVSETDCQLDLVNV